MKICGFEWVCLVKKLYRKCVQIIKCPYGLNSQKYPKTLVPRVLMVDDDKTQLRLVQDGLEAPPQGTGHGADFALLHRRRLETLYIYTRFPTVPLASDSKSRSILGDG